MVAIYKIFSSVDRERLGLITLTIPSTHIYIIYHCMLHFLEHMLFTIIPYNYIKVLHTPP